MNLLGVNSESVTNMACYVVFVDPRRSFTQGAPCMSKMRDMRHGHGMLNAHMKGCVVAPPLLAAIHKGVRGR
jgi:hypothetical protein